MPLAEKLTATGVFGSFGDECLTNAVNNRQDWRDTGDSLVESMAKTLRASRIPSLSLTGTPMVPRLASRKALVDQQLTAVAKKTTTSNLGAAMSSLMSKVTAMQQIEDQIASSGNQAAVATLTDEKRKCAVTKTTSSNLEIVLGSLMRQVSELQEAERQILSTSGHRMNASKPVNDPMSAAELEKTGVYRLPVVVAAQQVLMMKDSTNSKQAA